MNQLLRILFYCFGNWRYLLIVVLFANFFWVFFPYEGWFYYQSLVFLFCFCLGIVFNPQRLFFLGALLIYLFFNHSFLFSEISATKLQKCGYRPEFLQGYLDKKSENKLILSKVSFFCGKENFSLSSSSMVVYQKYIPTYAGEKIHILHPKIFYQEHRWHFISDKHTRFFATKQKRLNNKRSGLWKFWWQQSNYYLAGKAKQLYQGIALADRSSLSKDFRYKISSLGIFHLFAISGLHIGMIFLWVHFLWSKVFSLVLLFLPHKKKIFSMLWVDLLSMVLVWFYLYFIIFPITALRAWMMLLIWVMIRHILKWLPSVYILFLTAFVMILVHPSIIFSLSFQFSFLAVFAILVFSEWIHFAPTSLTNFYKSFVKTAAMTLAINLFTAPLSLLYFKEFNLLGFINNPFHIFFIGFAYLPLILLGFFLFPLGLEVYYFWLVQKVGDFWYWIMEKNFAWSKFAIYPKEGLVFSYFWLFYVFFLAILSIYSFCFQQKKYF